VAEKKLWKQEIVKTKKSKVSFNDFKEYTIYNAFAHLTKEQLKNLIKLAKEIKEIDDDFFISRSMIQNNLKIFVDDRYLN